MKTINMTKTGNGNFNALRLSLKEMRRMLPELDPSSVKRATRRAERHELNLELREGLQDELAIAEQIRAQADAQAFAFLTYSQSGAVVYSDVFQSRKVVVIRKKDAFTRRRVETLDVTVPLLRAA